MSALSAIEPPVAAASGIPELAGADRRPLRLVPEPGRRGSFSGCTAPRQLGQPSLSSMPSGIKPSPTARPARTLRTAAGPGSVSLRSWQTGQGVAARSTGRGGPAPLRLTRRGRAVAATLALAVATIAVLVLSLAASGGAQASNHGQPGAGYQGMREIVVHPGQTLWSIASAAEPSADPRLVIQQIISVNSLAGPEIHVGQQLWVPR